MSPHVSSDSVIHQAPAQVMGHTPSFCWYLFSTYISGPLYMPSVLSFLTHMHLCDRYACFCVAG